MDPWTTLVGSRASWLLIISDNVPGGCGEASALAGRPRGRVTGSPRHSISINIVRRQPGNTRQTAGARCCAGRAGPADYVNTPARTRHRRASAGRGGCLHFGGHRSQPLCRPLHLRRLSASTRRHNCAIAHRQAQKQQQQQQQRQ